jgi:hypothetical protein
VLLCSRFFRALWRTRMNSVADKPSPCFTPIPMTKGYLLCYQLLLWLGFLVSFSRVTLPSWVSQNSLVIPEAFFGSCCQKLF